MDSLSNNLKGMFKRPGRKKGDQQKHEETKASSNKPASQSSGPPQIAPLPGIQDSAPTTQSTWGNNPQYTTDNGYQNSSMNTLGVGPNNHPQQDHNQRYQHRFEDPQSFMRETMHEVSTEVTTQQHHGLRQHQGSRQAEELSATSNTSRKPKQKPNPQTMGDYERQMALLAASRSMSPHQNHSPPVSLNLPGRGRPIIPSQPSTFNPSYGAAHNWDTPGLTTSNPVVRTVTPTPQPQTREFQIHTTSSEREETGSADTGLPIMGHKTNQDNSVARRDDNMSTYQSNQLANGRRPSYSTTQVTSGSPSSVVSGSSGPNGRRQLYLTPSSPHADAGQRGKDGILALSILSPASLPVNHASSVITDFASNDEHFRFKDVSDDEGSDNDETLTEGPVWQPAGQQTYLDARTSIEDSDSDESIANQQLNSQEPERQEETIPLNRLPQTPAQTQSFTEHLSSIKKPEPEEQDTTQNTSPKAPTQNESRPRVGGTGLVDIAKETKSPTSPTQPTGILSPVKTHQPTVSDTESRAQAFLASQNIMQVSPGHDWLGTLIDWTKEQQRITQANQKQTEKAHRKELKRMHESWQQERQLGIQLHEEIRTKAKDITRIEMELNNARAAENMYDELKLKYDGSQSYIKTLESNNGTLQNNIDSKEMELGGLKIQIQSLNTKLQSIGSTHAENLAAAKREYEDEILRVQSQCRNDMESAATEHRQQIEELELQRSNLISEHRNALQAKEFLQIDLKTQHEKELKAKNQEIVTFGFKHKEEVRAIVQKHQEDYNTWQTEREDMLARHQLELQAKNREIAAAKRKTKEEVAQVTKKHRATIEEQQSQIASYSKDNYGFIEIDDTTFARSFQALVGEIDQLASQIWFPATLDFDNSLDPTNFLERNAFQSNWVWPRFVRSTCWTILIQGFFSMPLGFGALGHQGNGYTHMYPTYQAAALLNSNNHESQIIPNDKETNLYRALHFKRILSAIRADQGTGEVMLATMFETNVNHVTQRLLDILGHIVNAQLDRSCSEQAKSISRKMGILALEIGTQRAQVILEVCHYSDQVPAAGWKTEDATGAGTQTVDLMIHPCLSRIGDGRGELSNKKVLAKGEFVPLSTGYR
ncbi:hypothetical protein QBC38DRAFT_482388 [Podospora fimiseda]|uniref:Uncharacterized protein n=1 Tax=Podospora fimiseda TaxID=252190 RepID=A0AAN7BM01_9PEZI|nr:hypothetical protein QBC38DRAFT_482388 [Podospora fimiseda]